MKEDGKGIWCLGFLRELVCSRESRTRLLIQKSDYFKGVADAFNIRQRTDVWRWEWGGKALHNRAKPGAMNWKDRTEFCQTSGKVTTPAMATKSSIFWFSPRPLPALAWPRHSFQSASLSPAPAFRLPDVTSPPCCLPPLLRIPTRLLHQVWKVSAAYCGYRVDPSASCGGIIPRSRVCISIGHG